MAHIYLYSPTRACTHIYMHVSHTYTHTYKIEVVFGTYS